MFVTVKIENMLNKMLSRIRYLDQEHDSYPVAAYFLSRLFPQSVFGSRFASKMWWEATL